MGKTFKDESFGADGKFRKQRRTHERRNVGSKQKHYEPVFSDSYEDDLDYEESNKEKEDA